MGRRTKTIRLVLLTIGCLWGLVGWCQERQENGQAGAFARLSAKERTRLAKQEETEANQDVEYLSLMANAERLFQEQRFDEAMAVFEQAEERRPLNVYPKVKIDDLRVLISKRDAELREAQAASNAAVAPSGIPPSVPIQEPDPEHDIGAPIQETPGINAAPVVEEVVPDHAKNEAPSAENSATISVGQTGAKRAPQPQVAKRPPLVAPATEGERAEIPAPVLPDGVQEERFKEGQAIVLQRTCRSGHVVQVYRKVEHAWGKTFYFLDGLSVQERVWIERFGDR
ncbi:MAG: hypothetical protein IPK99_02560 [Flavobacteriales bacterium]|nr:hypothetical protein [Flavobacteriales bacterium]